MPQTGYFGFGDGFVLRTTDAGASWTQISSGSGAGVLAMDRFANGDLIAVGEGGRVLTRAAGSSDLAHPRDAGHSQSRGRAGRRSHRPSWPWTTTASCYRSADAGATWTRRSVRADWPDRRRPVLRQPATTDGSSARASAGRRSSIRVDAGATWTPVTDFQGTYVAVDFAGANGWAVAVYGILYRTIDGRRVLVRSAASRIRSFAIHDIDFWNADVGYVVGGSGYAARSDDGGLTWQMLPTPNTTDRHHRHRADQCQRTLGVDRRRQGDVLGDGRPELGRHGSRRRGLGTYGSLAASAGRRRLDRRLAWRHPAFLRPAGAAGQPATARPRSAS